MVKLRPLMLWASAVVGVGFCVACLTPATWPGCDQWAAMRRAKVARAREQAVALTVAVERYRSQTGRFPGRLEVLAEGKPALVDLADLLEPWGHEYRYDPAGEKNGGKRPDIWTVMRDGQVIGNWQGAQE